MATSTFPVSLLNSWHTPAIGCGPSLVHARGKQSDAVALAQAGDQDAFTDLYVQNKKHVFSICIRMVRDFSLAEDLTQETFLQVHRKLSSFRDRKIEWLGFRIKKPVFLNFHWLGRRFFRGRKSHPGNLF